MSLLRNFLVLVCLTVTAQACGFTPVYKQHNSESEGIRSVLETIYVKPIAFGRHGQELQTKLEDLLHPMGADSPDYNLEISIDRKKDALVIEKNREITRYKVVIIADYKLTSRETGKVVTKGRSRLSGSFDAVESDYATYTVEEDTVKRVMKEMANDIRFRLVTFFQEQEKPAIVTAE